MSCNDDGGRFVDREIELDASPEHVWDEIVLWRQEEGRVSVVDEVVPGERLTYWWGAADGHDVVSYVEIDLVARGVGTLVRVRETLVDGDALLRSVFSGCALARS